MRNTSPDWISAEQSGLPVALRDADLFFDLHPDLPKALHDAVDNGQALILRTDRRLGFDPTTPWTLTVRAVREHGVFQPEIGSVDLAFELTSEERFFVRKEAVVPLSPLQEALRGRAKDLIVLAALLIALIALLLRRLEALSAHPAFQPLRLTVLGVVVAFVGWWGQGQLSIVTPLATIQTTLAGGSFAFLLYDPFSLVIWGAAILGLILWGRGLFCGWLCPFGALQEFAAKLGSLLRIKPLDVPRAWDRPLRGLKYIVLAALIGVAIFAPIHIDKAAEVEPFKTAITTIFLREWYYVAYAVFWLLLSMVLFKGFCRYVCPLGALLAIGGVFRQKDWIARRTECGSPCQLCRVKCAYGAIEPTGEVNYSECFQCLDCVTIHESPSLCVPLVLATADDPFHATADPDAYVQRDSCEQALEELCAGLGTGRQLFVLHGPPGFGKTLVLRLLPKRLQDAARMVYVPYGALEPPGPVCVGAGPAPARGRAPNVRRSNATTSTNASGRSEISHESTTASSWVSWTRTVPEPARKPSTNQVPSAGGVPGDRA